MVQKILTTSLLLASFLLLSACGHDGRLLGIQWTDPEPTTIARVAPPRPMQPQALQWIVITDANYQEEIGKLLQSGNGRFVIYAIDSDMRVKRLRNWDDALRFMEQQQSMIAYYEDYLYEDKESEEETNDDQ